MKAIRLIITIAPVLAVAAGLYHLSGGRLETAVYAAEGDKGLVWMGFNEGLKKAKLEKKFVIIDFYADWCGWCKVMERETFGDSEVRAHMKKHYVLVRVHMDKNPQEPIQYGPHKLNKQELAGMMQVSGLPTVVFLDRDGGFIGGIPGFLKKDTFLPLLKYIRAECYKKKIKFNEYMANAAVCG